jgi:hypothetical protein
MKWTHKDKLRDLWVQRQLGDELYTELQSDYVDLVYIEVPSWHMPNDMYKDVQVFAEIRDPKMSMWFKLKQPKPKYNFSTWT